MHKGIVLVIAAIIFLVILVNYKNDILSRIQDVKSSIRKRQAETVRILPIQENTVTTDTGISEIKVSETDRLNQIMSL